MKNIFNILISFIKKDVICIRNAKYIKCIKLGIYLGITSYLASLIRGCN